MMSTIEFYQNALDAAWRRSDELFALVPERAWLDRPIGLRHPILFYVGHLPAFAWNQACRGALSAGHLDERLDLLYARGIDPEDDTVAKAQSLHAWPSAAETLAYRDEVRAALRRRLPDILARKNDILCENGRVLHLVLEHELMHHETLLYMLAECPPGLIAQPPSIPAPEGGAGRAAEPRRIEAGEAVIGAAWDEIPFGWDNEFGKTIVDVPAFELDSLPVRNLDWLEYFQTSGAPEHLIPCSWVRDASGAFAVKTLFGRIPFDAGAGFPVQVSGAQARLYCAWKGGRLPTEAELRRAAYHTPDGSTRLYPWGDSAPSDERGNFGFRRWYPTPVGHFPSSASAWGVEELVGNGWEWTSTPFAPLPGFSAWARTYPGYSADFFDGAHDIVFGASWATDDKLLRRSFRNWYRRNYEYPFTSFRVAR